MWKEAEKETNKIKKQNSKLRNSAIFGKSIENPMNKIGLNIMTTRKQCSKWSFRPSFKRERQFRNGAMAIEKEKYRIIYIGMSIVKY